MINSYQNSIIAQLLEAITGQINFTGTPTSNIGDILLSILEQTPYDKEPKSVLAELFLKLKDKLEGRAFTPYDKEPKSAIAEILLSILNETEYDKEPNSRVAELLLELKSELESYAELTASGAIANFTTSVVKPLVNLTAYFKATQEAGTPTPQSPKAISGVSAVNVFHRGFNLFDKSTVIDGEYINDTDGTARNDANSKRSDFIEIAPDTNYYIKSEQNQGNWGAWYDANKNFISGVNGYNSIRRSPVNARYIRLTCYRGGSGNIDTFCFNVSDASKNGQYEAYTGSTTLINLGGTYYGGYITQDKNGKRELVVTHKKLVLNGTENWTIINDGTATRAFIDRPVDKKLDDTSSICNRFEYGSATNVGKFDLGNTYFIFNVYDIADSKESFNAWLSENETYVIYPLAEPFTVALPDGEPITAFNGVNNIYNDSGDTSVTYLAKIADNLNATAKFRAEVKAQMLKAKEEEKEIIKEDPIEEIKEPVKDSGETKKGANKA